MGVLRFILALAVVASHAGSILGTHLVGGQLAVESFYMISGFYMALVLDRKYNYPGSYRFFVSQRLLRLLPLYWIVLALSVVVLLLPLGIRGYPIDSRAVWVEHGRSLTPVSLAVLVGANILLIGQDAIMFLGVSGQPLHLYWTADFRYAPLPAYYFLVLPQAWTVSVEILFYLCAPLVCRLPAWKQAILIVLSLLLRLYLAVALHLDHDPWNYRFFPVELAFFLVGSLAYRYYTTHAPQLESRTRPSTLIWLGLIGFIMFFDAMPGVLQSLYYAMFACALPFIFALTKDNAHDQHIGELSYPIYLVHLLVIAACGFFVKVIPIEVRGFVFALLSACCAAALVRIVETPLERFRTRRFARRRIAEAREHGHPLATM